jgi:hypothetical protein
LDSETDRFLQSCETEKPLTVWGRLNFAGAWLLSVSVEFKSWNSSGPGPRSIARLHWYTFKLSILSAILRPKTRLIKPSLDPHLNSPPRADLPKNRQNHFSSLCPTIHLINKFLIFLVWVRVAYPSSCLSWFSSPTSHYYFLASLFGVGYPIMLAVILPVVWVDFDILTARSNLRWFLTCHRVMLPE